MTYPDYLAADADAQAAARASYREMFRELRIDADSLTTEADALETATPVGGVVPGWAADYRDEARALVDEAAALELEAEEQIR